MTYKKTIGFRNSFILKLSFTLISYKLTKNFIFVYGRASYPPLVGLGLGPHSGNTVQVPYISGGDPVG